jgi:hypothetical protein
MSAHRYKAQPQNQDSGSARFKTNTLAISALVSSFFIGPTGVILGHIARHQIKDSGEGGRGLAITALVVGYTYTVIWAIITIRLFSTDGPNG